MNSPNAPTRENTTERNNNERRAEQNDRRMKEKLPDLLFPAEQDDVCEDQPADRRGIRDAEHQQHAEAYAVYETVHLGCSLTLAPLLRNRSERYIGSSKKSWDHSSVMFPSCTVPT